ncbi:MAG: SRPBCC family protein [Myxococcales bacterium]|nr:SRPBCC family protein [Myxococcales bacterium]
MFAESRSPSRPLVELTPPDARLLRAGLAFNAVLSTLCATALLTLTEPISQAVGLVPAELTSLGLALAVFVGALVWQVRRRLPHLLAALLTSVADLGWVLASVIYVATTPLPPTGLWLVGGVAAGVGMAATLQLLGLRRLIREPDPDLGTQHRYVWSLEVNAPPEQLWTAVRDLAGIHKYSAGLASSSLRSGPTRGPGAIRDCSNTKGEAWSERVVAWEEGRAIDLEFLAEAPGFPFPMTRLLGGWRLRPTHAGAQVQVYWSFDLQRPMLAPVVVPLLAHQIERSFPAVIAAMTAPDLAAAPALGSSDPI